jgi:polysaccharide export outer membrane protein
MLRKQSKPMRPHINEGSMPERLKHLEIGEAMVRSGLMAGRRAFQPVLVCLAGLLICLMATVSLAADYTLDTGDVLRIAVFGEPAYPLDLSVDDRGAISLPLLGEVEARGLTPVALSRSIKKAFQEQKLLVDPFVQVDIKEHRPFFISGAVAQPGSYPYKPGITIRHALAIAGGFKVATLGNEDPALKIADLRAERAKLLIDEFRHRARLEGLVAESEDRDDFAAPKSQPSDISPKLLNDILAAEQQQLRARRLAFQSEIAHIDASIGRAKKDAQTLAAARVEREKGAKFQLQQLETSRGLQRKGLVTNYNLQTAERLQNNYRVDIAQADVEEARSKQEILNLENEKRSKLAARKLDLINQIEQVRLEIAQIESSLKYVNDKLLFVSYYGQHRTFDDLRGSVRVVIYRGRDDAARTIKATETTEVSAGDVIEVSLLADRQFYDPNAASSAGQ